MITEIITALKSRATTYNGRIAGAAEFSVLDPAAKMDLPAAYVIPLDDSAEPIESENGYKQTIRDGFGVVVVLANALDEAGVANVLNIIPLRNELFSSILSWSPDSEHGPIEYEGGQMLSIDRARFYYQFEFSAETEIGEADTYQAVANAALSEFEGANINLDAIQPFDPNLAAIGPDGRNEATLQIDVPHN